MSGLMPPRALPDRTRPGLLSWLCRKARADAGVSHGGGSVSHGSRRRDSEGGGIVAVASRTSSAAFQRQRIRTGIPII